METNKTKAARGENSAALDTAGRRTDCIEERKRLQDESTAFKVRGVDEFRRAAHLAIYLRDLDEGGKREVGRQILHTLRAALWYSQIAAILRTARHGR